MVQIKTDHLWSNEQFVEQLIALSSEADIEAVLDQQREYITPSVLLTLKDHISRWVRMDLNQALRLANLMREAAALIADPVCIALADHTLAKALDDSGRYNEALQFYQRAEETYTRLGDDVGAARVARAKISPLVYLGRYEEALQVAARARQVFLQHDEPILLAQLESNVGNIYHRLDQYQEALIFYERAREIFLRCEDEIGLAHVSFNAANGYTNLNEFDRALGFYQQAQQIYEKLNMPLLVLQAEYSIAWLYFQRGKLQESLKLFAKVSAQSRQVGENVLEALCELDLCEVYLQLNAYEDAIESARSAIGKFQTLKMNYEYAKAQMYLGTAHTRLGDFPAAAQKLEIARRGFLDEGNEVFAALTNLYLSDVLICQQQWQQALELCIEARDLFHRLGLSTKVSYAELQLARLNLARGQTVEAQQLCQSVLAVIEQMEAPWLKYRCFHLLGNAVEQTGDSAQAYRYYTQAVDHLEDLRSTIGVDEFKCTFLKDKLRVYEDLVELCLRSETEETIEEALTYVEAVKSRTLVDLLAASRTVESKASGAVTDALHQEWQALREQLDWFYNRLHHHELRTQQCPDRLPQLRREVHQREQAMVKLMRRMWLEDTEYTSLHSVSRFDVSQVRQRLASDEVLVEYYVARGQVKAFVVTSHGVHYICDLSTVQAVASLLRTLRFNISKFTLSNEYVNRHQEQLRVLTNECLKQLHTQLIKPIASWLEGRKVIFVPHDILHYIPFHALYDGREYLIDRCEISYCPSASVFTLCVNRALHLSEKSEVRNPKSETNPNCQIQNLKWTPQVSEFELGASKFPTRGRVLIMAVPDEATPFIHDEVEAVKLLWPDAHVLIGKDATLAHLKHHASEYRFLHLASHGVFRRDNPLFSTLKLGDSWLSFYDIFNLHLNAELVTLSACETGLNQVFPGDELFGLMRGFLYAGAPSLMVSLWMVNDRSTAAFMRWFYAGLKVGLSKRAALRQAQLMVKQEYPHPYYWAPFVLTGAAS